MARGGGSGGESMQMLNTYGAGDGNSVTANHNAEEIIMVASVDTSIAPSRTGLSINGNSVSITSSDIIASQNHAQGYGYTVFKKSVTINEGDTVTITPGTLTLLTACF